MVILNVWIKIVHNLISKAILSHQLNKQEIVSLLSNDDCNEVLFKAADEIRKKFVGDEIHLRALIEFSNICQNNCCYCGLRRGNKNITRYRLDEDSIFHLAEYAVTQLGLKTIVLQSGEDLWFSQERLCALIRRIKTLDTALTLSIGEKTYADYLAYKNAGCDRFLLRIETTDKALYEKYDPDMSWNERKQCLLDIKSVGLETGTGCLVGLPNQTIESLADDILFFKEIGADMVGIGPLIPHPDTPLAHAEGGTFTLACKVMALTRLILPDINIPATTAMETLEPNGQLKALQSGANVIMPNVTLSDVRQHYELYPGKSSTNLASCDALVSFKQKLISIGRTIGQDYGAHKKSAEI